ncbi:ABC transporter ATP-binding protein [Actinomadura kijaniata]|uniref:Putative ABC transport system ATP-binding protein n=1 Tax=Actinomadura namibiensis TaxID=182080 RepID=A0A7W3LLS2_ACTNM|nr:ABC transporter ATP-binding protein [Actinomadura namibiensis]MBA8950464.1 putative ABC transport system ATP-binding protein [Actinomadura namibiensis]
MSVIPEPGDLRVAGPPPEPVLAVEGVTKRFKLKGRADPLTVLEDVTLTVRPGATAAIVGLSGAGKSTLLNVLGLLERPDTGTVRIYGRETTTMRERDRAGLRGETIGFVFQQLNLLQRRTARQQVAAPLLYAGGRTLRRRYELADEALRRVGLGERLHATQASLSGGEQQRVAIARALIRDPRLILADEPTGALDPQTAAQVMDLLFDRARAEDRALVLVTHDHALARRADDVYVLDKGRLSPA